VIHDASTLPLPLRLRADLCVVGSGAGGSAAAMAAAEAGLSVLVVEGGAYVPPSAMTQREEQMLPQLLQEHAGRTTRDRAVRIHQGRCLGGSTVHNTNLCRRIPPQILREWQRTRGLTHLTPGVWNSLYAEVEAALGVAPIPEAQWNRHNRLLAEAARALGWRWNGLSHNRTGCIGSGFCELGCAYDAKNNAAKILVPRAIRAGAEFLTCCQAVRVLHDGRRASGVEGVVLDPRSREPLGTVRVDAERVCVAGSATATPALLLRSRVPDPSQRTGRSLRIHPAVVAAGVFDEAVRAWEGIPQSVECTEFLDFDAAHPEPTLPPGSSPPPGSRTWILSAFAHPVGTATMVPGTGAEHMRNMRSYAHLAVVTALLHDRSEGRVRPRGELGLSIDYWPDEADRRELILGLRACVDLLFAAGARRVLLPTDPPMELSPHDERGVVDRLELRPGLMDLNAVHPMGTVPMGDDPRSAPVDSRGCHHRLAGLWVADGSLFPSSIGGPPQLSIYALGLHVGRAIAAAG
jgi:choline dehydrogenase-like flavoprotein